MENTIRDNHYLHLNGYRASKEYSDYCPKMGMEKSSKHDDLPSLIGNRWEINEEIFWYFLEILPPLSYKNGCFYMSEFCFDDITTKYTQEGDKYYCEFARLPLPVYKELVA